MEVPNGEIEKQVRAMEGMPGLCAPQSQQGAT